MRRIEIAVRNASIPVRRVEWQRIKDDIRSQWSQMNRRPFSGPTAVGYEWRLLQAPPPVILASLWPRVVDCVSECVAAGQEYVGVCRFTKATHHPRLTISMEGV